MPERNIKRLRELCEDAMRLRDAASALCDQLDEHLQAREHQSSEPLPRGVERRIVSTPRK